MASRTRGGARRTIPDAFTMLHPFFWPRRVRRLFLLVFPLSVAVWLLLWFCLLLEGLVTAIGRPAVRFWSRPARVRHGYYGRY